MEHNKAQRPNGRSKGNFPNSQCLFHSLAGNVLISSIFYISFPIKMYFSKEVSFSPLYLQMTEAKLYMAPENCILSLIFKKLNKFYFINGGPFEHFEGSGSY